MENIPLSSDESDYDKPKTNSKTDNVNISVDKHSIKNSLNSKNQHESNNDNDNNEKQKLISQIIELQYTLEDLSSRVETVKDENMKLRSENQILSQYNENLMNASSVFNTNSPKSNRRG